MSNKPPRSAQSVGYLMTAIVLFGNGFQPIINNGRPEDLDTLLFTLATVFFEFILITPIVLYEQKKGREKHNRGESLQPSHTSLSAVFKQNWKKLLLIGSIFALATIFVIQGFTGTDSITGAVAVKTQPATMFLIGLFFLNERVKWADVLFSAVMLTSVIYVISKGNFNIGSIDISVIWLIIAPIMWNIGHSITKPLFNQRKVTPTQLIFFRTGISLSILVVIYLFFGDLDKLWQFFSLPHLFFMFLMGLNYAFMHYFWYNTIKRIDLTIATSLIIPAPIITATFAVFFLGEDFYLFHLFGMIGTFVGIYGMLLVQKRKKEI